MAITIFLTFLAALIQGEAAVATGLASPDVVTRGNATCRGERATHIVMAGEELNATHERDVIVILGNGATVYTNLGNDLVCVYGSDEPTKDYGHGSTILGADGNKTIITYGGSNYIQTLGGNDLIFLNGDEEEVESGGGDDHVWALGASRASVRVEDGTDFITGSPGIDHLYGGDDNDLILGNNGNDFLFGENGDDLLFGGFGQDSLDGGENTDECEDTDSENFLNCEEIDQPPAPPFPEAG